MAAYKGRYKFYFVDERTEEGESTMQLIDGEAHAETFWHLAEDLKEQSHWNWTFVKGKGYMKNKVVLPEREFRGAGPPDLPIGGVSLDDFLKMANENPEILQEISRGT